MRSKNSYVVISNLILFIGYYYFSWSLLTVIIAMLAEIVISGIFTTLMLRNTLTSWDHPQEMVLLGKRYPDPNASPDIQRKQSATAYLLFVILGTLVPGVILIGIASTRGGMEVKSQAILVAITTLLVRHFSEYFSSFSGRNIESVFSPNTATKQGYLKFFEVFAISWLMMFFSLPIGAFIFLKLIIDLAIANGKIRVGSTAKIG